MDRIMLGRSLILHIKCFYIGSVIPIRREPSFLLSMWLTGCCDRGPRSCRRRACWRRRSSSWRRWWTETASNEEGQKHAWVVFFCNDFVLCMLSCANIEVPAYFVSQSRHHFVFDYGDVAILNQCHYEVIPQQTLVLGTSWYHVCRWRFQRVVL